MIKKATIRDVAEKAGVSRGAAWAALSPNKQGIRVSEATRSNVRAVAKELNFTPNIVAKSLVCQKSFLIGYIFNRPTSLYAMNLIDSINRECIANEYSLVVYPVSSLEEERHSLNLAVSRRVDVLLALPYLDSDGSNNLIAYQEVTASGIPLVQLLFPLSPKYPCFCYDFHYIGKTATEYLLQHGHRKITCVTHCNYLDKTSGMMSYGHYHGYQEAMRAADQTTSVFTHETVPGLPKLASALQLANDIINQQERPTALVCSSNYAAYALIKSLETMGIKVPEDISIFGCTNNFNLPQIVMPELTTFMPCYDWLGSQAVRCGLSLSGSENVGKQIKPDISEGDTVLKVK